MDIYGAYAVPYEDSFLIVGGGGSDVSGTGFLDTIYKYEADTDSWAMLDTRLPRPTVWTMAMLVDSEIFPPCQ